jgi:hypothetical protein
MLFEAVINYLCAAACSSECINGSQSLVGSESHPVERRGQVDNIVAFYSGGSRFLSWLEDGSSDIFVHFLSPCGRDFFLSSIYFLNYYPLIILSFKVI